MNNTRLSIFLCLYLGVNTTIALQTGFKLHWVYPPLIYLAFTIFLLVVFGKKFRIPFLKTTSFTFTDNLLKVEILNFKTDKLERIDKINYCDVKNFKAVDSAKDDTGYMRINLKNGDTYYYTLTNQREGKNNINITDKVFDYFNSYNDKLQDKNDKIAFTPTIFGGKAGNIIIIGLTILVVIALTAQIIWLRWSNLDGQLVVLKK